jgi:multiple sugar transport system permease protein
VKLKKDTIGDILNYLFYLVIIIIFGGPVLWLFSLSLRTPQQLVTYPPTIFPHPISFGAYKEVLRGGEIFTFLFNSIKISFLASFGTLFVTVPSAYGLSRFDFKRKGLLLIIILLFQMISPVIIVIPLYRYFSKIGLLNSYLGIILVYISILIPLITWILKGFFDSIPKSIEEAAMIDGCSRGSSLIRIILPISSTGIFSAFIFAFLLSWSEFIVPLILLDNSRLLPISVGIFLFQADRSASTHIVSAAAFLTILPPILIFIFLQRYIVKVLTAGAIKG